MYILSDPKTRILLAGLTTSDGAPWGPVQVQKFFFIVQERVGDAVGGPFFEFKPDSYGPLSTELFRSLEALDKNGLLHIEQHGSGSKAFWPTVRGHREGEKILSTLPRNVQDFMARLAAWMQPLNFTQLVTAVIRDFPDSALGSPKSQT